MNDRVERSRTRSTPSSTPTYEWCRVDHVRHYGARSLRHPNPVRRTKPVGFGTTSATSREPDATRPRPKPGPRLLRPFC